MYCYSNDFLYSSAKTSAGVARKDVFSPFQNIATLSNINHFEGSLFYQNRFGMKELSNKCIQMAIPTSMVNIGICGSSFGFSEYNENIIGIGFARKFSEKFMLATQFDYYNLLISKNEGFKGKVLVQIGVLSQPIDKLYIGFQIFNPSNAQIEANGLTKNIPSVFSLGSSYWFYRNLVGSVQLDKDIRQDARCCIEFEYTIIEAFLIKLGSSYQNDFIPNMGFGIRLSSFSLDTAFDFHPVLGINTRLGLTYQLK
jgi:hypothetical protein